MSEHTVAVQWQRNQAKFTDNKYKRLSLLSQAVTCSGFFQLQQSINSWLRVTRIRQLGY
jgi:hypothetical protein